MVPKLSSFVSKEKRDYNDKDKNDILNENYFGVSCALFAVHLLSLPREFETEQWSEAREKMLRGSTQLLGLLAWRVQRKEIDLVRLGKAERDLLELKRIRLEDSKANEKVVGIFAAQEQSWLIERKKLRQHIGALMTELRFQEKRKDQIVSEMNEKLKDMDKNLAEESEKRRELEQKLRESESCIEALREKAKRECQEHSSDIRKHKTAFIELVSNQRHLEAEMSRAVRLVEAKKRQLESALKHKEESVLMVQKLSAEMVKMHGDLEQKDKILSATLRKSKVDSAERQMLVKEVKLSKAKRKQAELEMERWKAVSESRHERTSLRNMFAKQVSSRSMDIVSLGENGPTSSGDLVLEDQNEDKGFCPNFDAYSFRTNYDIDVKHVENWARSEAERFTAATEQRHRQEIDAFVEQLRLKDEKLEAIRLRLLSTELESKRLQTHIEGLNKELVQLRHNAIKTEAVLLGKDQELTSLKDSICQRVNIEEETRETVSNSVLTVQSPDKEFEDYQKGPSIDEGISSPVESIGTTESLKSPSQQQQKQKQLNRSNSSQWKMDLHALGVSYKLKRLKQQFVMLERLRGNKEESEEEEQKQNGNKGFSSLIALVNKQIGRYQSLQVKVDDLCKRMHESDLELCREDSKTAPRTKEKTKILEHFLEETFQVQRYIVGAGQKLMEIQGKVSSGFFGVAAEIDKSTGFDSDRFSESVKSLFQDVQRGIEVRIARVIGDLEGTLACEGMIRLRR